MTATTDAATTKKGKKPLKVAGVELDALPAWADGAQHRTGGDGRFVRPAELRDSPLNPRRKLDARAVHEIASSIRQHGWFGELLAREVAKDSTGKLTWVVSEFAPSLEGYALELVFGHHRKAAALLAGLEHVRVEVRALSDQQVARLQMIENLARGDLHPLEECAGFRAMLVLGETAEQIADDVGRPLAFVRKRLALAQLSDRSRAAFDGGHMHVGHAELLAGIPHEEQAWVLDHFPALEGKVDEALGETLMTVRELALTIRDDVLLDLEHAPWELHDAGLVPDAGACSACPKRTGAESGLFAEVVTDQRCADSTCYARKREALIALSRARAAARAPEGRPVLLLSTDFAGYASRDGLVGEDAEIVRRDAWKPVGETRCPSAQPGVVVAGAPKGIGADQDVCADPACKTHWGKNAAARAEAGKDDAKDEAARAQRKKEREAEKVRKAAEAITVAAIVRSVLDGGVPAREAYADDLRMVARTLWRALWQDVRFAWANLQPGSSGDVDHETAEALFKDTIGPNRSEEELDAVLVGLALAQDVTHPAGEDGKALELARAAKRHGVDAKAVLRDAKDSVAGPAEPAKDEKPEPAKAKKGKAKA